MNFREYLEKTAKIKFSQPRKPGFSSHIAERLHERYGVTAQQAEAAATKITRELQALGGPDADLPARNFHIQIGDEHIALDRKPNDTHASLRTFLGTRPDGTPMTLFEGSRPLSSAFPKNDEGKLAVDRIKEIVKQVRGAPVGAPRSSTPR